MSQNLIKWAKKNPTLAVGILVPSVALIGILTTITLHVVPWLSQVIPRERLSATISHINADTGAMIIHIDNDGNRDAMVSRMQFTIRAAPIKSLRPITSTNLLELTKDAPGIPVWLPAHVGILRSIDECLFTIELLKDPGVVVPAGKPVTMESSPVGDTLGQTARIFEDDTSLELGILIRVLDHGRKSHAVRHTLGNYFINNDRSELKTKRGYTDSFRLLSSPRDTSRDIKFGAVSISTNLTKDVLGRVPENRFQELGPGDVGIMVFFGQDKPYVTIDPALFSRQAAHEMELK